MPLVIKPAAIHIKDDNGNYYPQNIVAEKTTEEYVTKVTQEGTKQVTAVNSAGSAQVSAVQNKGDTVLASIPSDYTSLQNDVDSLREDLTYIEKFTGAEWISGYINSSGTFTGNQADRAVSSYVPCPPYASVTYVGENNHSNICGISFYDKDFAFISGDINSGTLGDAVTVTSPAGTKYLRVSTKTSILSDSYFSFGETKNNVLSSLQDQIVRDTVYVDGTKGSDSTGNGSRSYPYATITRALADGIFNVSIAPGTYNETLSFDRQRFHLFARQQAYSNSALTRPKVILDGGSSLSCGLTTYYPPELILEGITFQNYTANGCYIIYGGNIQIKDCTFANNGSNGLRIDSVDALVADCVAYSNTKDGFNINGYGSTQFINCCGHDNGDDGISHHQGTVGVIIGGEWYNNVKGGVASPCYGAKVDIHNVYSHDNRYGIYAYATDSTDAQGFKIWDCVLTNNSDYGIAVKYNQPTLYNNKVSGNTTGQTTAYGTVSFITLD